MNRALSLVAAAVALWPSAALAADVSNPDSLRAILPDPTDTTWVEAVQGQSGYLEGPLTYDSITAYYTYYQQTAAFIDSAISPLREDKYQGGYERSWYRPRTQDQLIESVEVFATPAYARSAMAAAKANDHASLTFGSYFDPQLGSDAYGELDGGSDYHFAAVVFAKGNAVYDVGAASAKALKPDGALPQAEALFAAAPETVGIPAPPQSPLARFMLPLVVTFLSGAGLMAAALVLAVVSTIRVRPVQAGATRA